MFCKNCGKEIDDNAYVCVHCGVKVAEEPAAPVQVAAEPKKRNTAAFVLGIIGFIIALASAYVGVYYCVAPAVAIALCIVSIVLAKKNGDGCGLAIAGLVIGCLTLVVWVIIWVLAIDIIRSLLLLATMY